MNDNEAELKPCPFCGASAYIEQGKSEPCQMHGDRSATFRVVAMHTDSKFSNESNAKRRECHVRPTITRSSREDVIEAWNTRAQQPSPVPLPEANSTYNAPPDGWVCYHCGERFISWGSAQDHFGAFSNGPTGCLMRVKLGTERGWLMEIRKLQEKLAESQQPSDVVEDFHIPCDEVRLNDPSKAALSAMPVQTNDTVKAIVGQNLSVRQALQFLLDRCPEPKAIGTTDDGYPEYGNTDDHQLAWGIFEAEKALSSHTEQPPLSEDEAVLIIQSEIIKSDGIDAEYTTYDACYNAYRALLAKMGG